MAFYDKFPYTNFQELNLDWITQEVSKVRDNRDASDASAAAALASEQAAKASETAAASSQQAAANSETAAAGSASAAAESEAQAAQSASQIESEIVTANARIDNLLVTGTPTEGNAELIDIRMAADTVRYTTAGESVRNQVSPLITATKKEIEVQYGINRFIADGVINIVNNPKRASTPPMIGKKGETIYVKPFPPYKITLHAAGDDNVWSSPVLDFENGASYTFTENSTYILQIVSNNDIPDDVLCCELYSSIPFLINAGTRTISGTLFPMEIGSLYDGSESESNIRIRSQYIKVKRGQSIIYKSPNMNCLDYSWYNNNFEFDQSKSHEWNDGNASVIKEDGYIRILLRGGTYNPTISESQIPEMQKMLVIEDYMPTEMEVQKMLNDSISSEIPSGITAYPYYGEKIDLKNKIGTEPYTEVSNPTGQSRQGATVYNDILFVAYNTLPMISLFNMRTKKHIGNITMQAVPSYHCNNINFGPDKYDASDQFPLLYISMENIEEHKCMVYRITESAGVYNATLVQEIIYPDPDSISMYYPNAVIDQMNRVMYITGYTKHSYVRGENNRLRILSFILPDWNSGNVTLNINDALSDKTLNCLTSTQGAFVNGSRIIQVYGLPAYDPNVYLAQIDPEAGVFSTLIRLNDIGITTEPESVFKWNEQLYILFVDGNIRRVYLS